MGLLMNGPVELRGGRARVNMTGSELPFSPCLLLQDPGRKYDFLSLELRARLAPQSPGLGPTGGAQPGLHGQPPRLRGRRDLRFSESQVCIQDPSAWALYGAPSSPELSIC